MSRWDELEKAAVAARDMPKSVCIRVEDVEFREKATPETVLTLIKQNNRMRQALLELRNHSSVTAHQIEAIDAAIGEDQ